VFDGRGGADRVLVATVVLFAPPMFVTGSSTAAVVDVETVAFDDLELPDGVGRLVVAIVLPWNTDGSVMPGR
jgi:hypothetical protein